MNKPIHEFFSKDHRRIEILLDQATADPDQIQMDYYHQFRVGILTHIKMEETLLFPAAQKANNGQPLPIAGKLRLDHGAITAMMAVPPTPELIKVIRYILDKHDILEEEPGGMYDICEMLTKDQTDSLLKKLHQTTAVPVHPINTSPSVFAATIRALARAGYDYDTLSKR